MARQILVRVKPTTFRLPAKTYKIRRKGKVITVHRKAKVVKRKGYTYKRKDVGKPGKGPKLIKIKKGKLVKYGYSTKKPASARRRALAKAVKAYGAATVWRMLHAQVILRKRTQKKVRRKFEVDRDWVAKKYGGPVPKKAIRAWKRMPPAERARRMPGGRI